ncbi:uncharacterized metalloprotease HI_0409-like [Ylistrum balloti]|uniref:uncharacterized metalloprotease HI_0409-like n=1 Tax=Ylistrum balloti TaxID=509963 RepID=UPI002905AD19|nr:uncharacterized metalloprotease HI_0409-like [Ylistrum balloti]
MAKKKVIDHLYYASSMNTKGLQAGNGALVQAVTNGITWLIKFISAPATAVGLLLTFKNDRQHQSIQEEVSQPVSEAPQPVETTESLETIHQEELQTIPKVQPEARIRFGPVDPFQRLSIVLTSGQTLFQAIIAGGVPRDEANVIIRELQKFIDFRRLQTGDRFEGILWLGEKLIEATFYHGKLDRYYLTNQNGKLLVTADPIELLTVTETVQGIVKSSLFEAIYEAQEKPLLIMSFIDLFSWDFDFNVSTKRGDRFEMLVEKRYLKDKFFGYGPILAGRYMSTGVKLEACWYQPETNPKIAGYYHLNGNAVKGAFLRTPLKYTRISSHFTLNRFHPVLKIRRPHRGIDYAAPLGTPVYAVSSGVVVDARWMGGAGRAVRIKHPNGWITSYSHLSKILVKKGRRVQQGQVVGRVGSSGYSTGPHLDYRIKINGRFVNPLKIKFPKGKSVPKTHLADFKQHCQLQLAKLNIQ